MTLAIGKTLRNSSTLPFSPGGNADGAKAMLGLELQRRQITTAAKMGALIAETREKGTQFGKRLFEDSTRELFELIGLERSHTDREPDLAFNIPSFLAHYERAAQAITVVHAIAGKGKSTEAGFAHWLAARAEFGAEILRHVGALLIHAAETLGQTEKIDEWTGDLHEVVLAFVFPAWPDSNKSDAWKQERIDRYEAIRLALRKHHGWDEPLV